MTRLITLYPTQVSHASRLVNNLNVMKVAFDKSEPGSGKTYVAIYTFEELFAMGICDNIVIIPPNESKKTWLNLVRKLGKPYILEIHTKICAIPLNCINEKTLVVVDEIQVLATINIKTASFISVVDRINKVGARILLISATPFSDYNHAYALFSNLQLLGDLPKVAKPSLASLKAFNYAEFLQNVKKNSNIDIEKYGNYTGKIADRLKLFHDVLMDAYSSLCPRSLPPTLVIKSLNVVYKMIDDDRTICEQFLEQFRRLSGFSMMTPLRNLNTYELCYMADAALTVLAKPNTKVILCVLDNEHVNLLLLFFGKYKYACLTIDSGVSQLGRQSAQLLFNMYNLLYRIIIVTYIVANSGISLHDNAPRDKFVDGFPRTLISFIDPNPVRRSQLFSRHIRTGITSDYAESLAISTNLKESGTLEKNVIYNKTRADVDLINMTITNTEEASLFNNELRTINMTIYNNMKKVINDMDEYVCDES